MASSSRPGSRLGFTPALSLPLGIQHGAGGCHEVHMASPFLQFLFVSAHSFLSKVRTLGEILKHEADVLSKSNCSLADAQELCSCISGRCLQTANCSGSLSAFAACKWRYYSLIALAHRVVFWLVSSYSASQRQGKRNICLNGSQLLTCRKQTWRVFSEQCPSLAGESLGGTVSALGRGVRPAFHEVSCCFSARSPVRRMRRMFLLTQGDEAG